MVAPVRRSLLPLAAAAALAAVPGCVERKLIIRSDPPGALVALEDVPLEQRTPAEVETPWDGIRRVTLTLPGHEVLETTAEVKTRWHDWFPLDVFADLLWPGTIEDVQVFEYRLEPYFPVDQPLSEAQKAELKSELAALGTRADAARAAENVGAAEAKPAAPAGAAEPPPPPPAPRGTGPAKPAEPAPGPAKPPAPRRPQVAVDLPPLPVRPPEDEPRKPAPPGQPLPPPVLPPAPVK